MEDSSRYPYRPMPKYVSLPSKQNKCSLKAGLLDANNNRII